MPANRRANVVTRFDGPAYDSGVALGIVHRPIASAPSGKGTLGSASLVSWRTCLREVTFFDPDVSGPAPGAPSSNIRPLTGEAAYEFLLETICGLHSPMLGETQVLGQFRKFLASLPPADASWLGPIGRQLMSDARTIRERHLRGLGSRSYGSAVRRHLDGADTVALVGAGAFATELLPYLSDGRRVDQWTRQDIARAEDRGASPVSAVVVVAAPVGNDAVSRITRCYARIVRVIDLRSADERQVIDAASVVTLDDVFASVEAAAADTPERVERARRDIRGMAAAFDERPQLRPFGWDDLCA
jgi:glutamyl-tRNA reductase